MAVAPSLPLAVAKTPVAVLSKPVAALRFPVAVLPASVAVASAALARDDRPSDDASPSSSVAVSMVPLSFLSRKTGFGHGRTWDGDRADAGRDEQAAPKRLC